MSSLTSRYYDTLLRHLSTKDRAAFLELPGAEEDDITQVLEAYPNAPVDVIELLRLRDGTPFELPILGWHNGDFWEGYSLNSCRDIIGNKSRESIIDFYGIDYSESEGDEIFDPRIDVTIPMFRRLFFAADTTFYQLYVDVDPAPGGTVGQVIRFAGDGDEWLVIAPSFADYLQQVIDAYGYP